MGIDQTVVMGVALVILLALFVSAFDYVIPLIIKFEFDVVCRKYVLLSESQNGLTGDDFQTMKSELEHLGLIDNRIECGKIGDVKRGLIYVFEVKGIYLQKRFVSIFTRAEAEIQFKFKQDYLARKIVM